MATIKIYRKVSTAAHPVKLSKANAAEIERRIEIKARVQRPSLLAHFLPTPTGRSAFHRQEALTAAQVDNRAKRILDHADAGWVVPSDSLGRKGEVNASQAQSILLWIKQNVAAYGLCDPSEVSVVVE